MTRFPRWLLALATSGVLFLVGCSSSSPPVAAPSSPQTSAVPSSEVEPSYEAVFLRLEVVDNSADVIVVGVNAEGRE